ncbi:MAG: putative quinol monooxygenase [Acidobacteria bacterium]|jgi:quinol monooxygenase YgiN|nr:putative quinol monooxygenase [Acidobacteriota bacterium]
MHVVAVLFEIRPEGRQAFRAAMLKNAAASRRERGCRRFDVCYSEDGLNCFLYEQYVDRAAFDEHLNSPHFAEFKRTFESLAKLSRLERYELVEET